MSKGTVRAQFRMVVETTSTLSEAWTELFPRIIVAF